MAAEQETPERRTAPTGPEGAAVSRDPGPPDTAPDDANDLQGFHLPAGGFMRKRSTWLWAGIPTVVLAIALAFGPLGRVWIILVALWLLITTIVCWIVANWKAEDDFFKTYAEQRRLTRTDRGTSGARRRSCEKGTSGRPRRSVGPDRRGRQRQHRPLHVHRGLLRQGREARDRLPLHRLDDGPPRVPEGAAGALRQPQGRLPRFEKVEDAFRSNERVKLESEQRTPNTRSSRRRSRTRTSCASCSPRRSSSG